MYTQDQTTIKTENQNTLQAIYKELCIQLHRHTKVKHLVDVEKDRLSYVMEKKRVNVIGRKRILFEKSE